MKTAISIPDEVFVAAEDLAARLGVSRSQLYANAVDNYVRAMRSHGVTAQLDKVYGSQTSFIDPAVSTAQVSTIATEDW
jgi:citrate lyase beta subunit